MLQCGPYFFKIVSIGQKESYEDFKKLNDYNEAFKNNKRLY